MSVDDDSVRVTVRVLYTLASLGIVAWAAVDAFGALHGWGIVAAVWLLMPAYREDA